ncbi:protein of unknown function [Bartonella clarridgeiae 73]|uniref:Uncharacterized protein n=1 Tax=Bartonella clarridgeiae (strain CCUG 45776 / CIP 104772 / 73) TaxID=696125 RepID=E6YI43_BARC7|nr:protein of unknown function [Bartonella clarridgeiae 73]
MYATIIKWACSSAGEHYVDIVGVTGSIPVTPTGFTSATDNILVLLISFKVWE